MNTRLVRSLALTTAALFALPTLAAHAEGWGTLTGRIAVVGEVPEPKPLNVGPAICNAFNLKDERLIVNRTNGGLANVCIWLSANRRGDAKPAIHPELQDLVNAKVILDNRNCRFEPHVAVMWTEQIVELVNSDPMVTT